MELTSDALAREGISRRLLRSGPGGVLLQEEDSRAESVSDWKLVSKRAATAEEREGLFFLWKVARHVVSNGIVIGRGDRTLGIGAGQTSRVDAVEVALMKARRAGHDARGAWLASDGFFPFRDSIDAAAKAGIRAIVEPGGSIRDEECIMAADEHDMVMYFTGRRCFKH
jgi:phosphoribosylaminoimidazolecarboxamide formyltransferase/IMP cyclohydrolase